MITESLVFTPAMLRRPTPAGIDAVTTCARAGPFPEQGMPHSVLMQAETEFLVRLPPRAV